VNAAIDAEALFDLSDEVLVLRARGDAVAMDWLMDKYKSFVHVKARGYFLMGADREDLCQEGMIGLYKAVRDFKPEKSNFRAFAEMCVVRQIITAIKTATRQKHHFLNHAVSVDKPLDGEERTLLDVLPDSAGIDPLLQLERREVSEDVRKRILAVLSDLEQEVLTHYLSGRSYAEIGLEMQRGVKSIDNALQRAKRKIGESIASAR
jgi:RNA polymerase sporulation-specific sigma factor